MERDKRSVELQRAADVMRGKVLEVVQDYDLTPTETVHVLLLAVKAYNDYALSDERERKR